MKSIRRILEKFVFQLGTVSFLLGSLALNCRSQEPGKQPRTVTLKQGQVLQMKLVKRLNSGRAHAGADVLLKLTEPLSAEGQIVLPKGGTIHARIRNVKRAAQNCQHGSLDWELQSVMMPRNEIINIRFLKEGTARRRLEQTSHDAMQPVPEATAGAQAPGRKGTSVMGILKGMAAVPVVLVVFPLAVMSEGEASCPGGKGREESFWAGKRFYAEVNNDVSVNLH